MAKGMKFSHSARILSPRPDFLLRGTSDWVIAFIETNPGCVLFTAQIGALAALDEALVERAKLEALRILIGEEPG